MVDVDLSCGVDTHHKHQLFVTTYLGFGANEARRRYIQSKAPEVTGSAPPSLGNSSEGKAHFPVKLLDPCAPVDMHEAVTSGGRALTLHGTGDFGACKSALLPILQGPSNCSEEQSTACTSDVLSAPPIDIKMEFYGFSEFWYTMDDVLRMGGAYEKHKFEEAASVSCCSLPLCCGPASLTIHCLPPSSPHTPGLLQQPLVHHRGLAQEGTVP